MTKKLEIKLKRRNYSLTVDKALELSRQALKLSEKANKIVSKQDVLETLVTILSKDAALQERVLELILKK